MKVCTDSCIFGAWLAQMLACGKLQANTCLDIGAGNGLLSLMLAQKSPAIIDAIEIENNAFEQLKDNFKISPWNTRLQPINGDAKTYSFQNKYDLIISNPPFYDNDLLSVSETKNIAKHNTTLTVNELLLIIKQQLATAGNFAVLLPYHRLEYFEKLASENHFFLREKVLIKHTLRHEHLRGILIFDKQQTESCVVKELIIKNEDETYSDEFTKLMKDYYVKL